MCALYWPGDGDGPVPGYDTAPLAASTDTSLGTDIMDARRPASTAISGIGIADMDMDCGGGVGSGGGDSYKAKDHR